MTEVKRQGITVDARDSLRHGAHAKAGSVWKPVNAISSANSILYAADELLHALQYERGCTSLYLDSQGRVFGDRIARCRSVTDEAASRLAAISGKDLSGEEQPLALARLADLRRRIGELPALRANIDGLAINYTAAVNAFTFTFNMPLIDTMGVIAHGCAGFNLALVSAFAHFLQWKERIGRERALGARGFHTFAFRNPEFWDRMAALTVEARTCLDTFISLASPRQIEIVKTALASPEMQEIDAVHDILVKRSAPAEIERFTGEQWFDLTSRFLDILHRAEKQLIDGLAGRSAHRAFQPDELAGTVSAVTELRPYVRGLSLFARLGDAELNNLLTHAQVRQYPRGKLLFLQGEQAQRMYVIVNGWVKVYNGLESGEETILQMLTSGDTLLEAAVFLNTAAPVSAQVIDDATLLSIPAPVIRQRVSSSNALAVTMLNNISLRSQMLIYQIEQNRLKDARARVGWFLLRLLLAQGNESNVIQLPYDKSIIASYLDMRPETFSRVLKKMKTEGLEVESEKIVLGHRKLLCEFCDSYVARDCRHALTQECPSRDRLDLDPEDVAQA